MYKRTKYKVAFYPAYTNAYKYYRQHVNTESAALIDEFETWLVDQGAYFHKRDPHMKQNHNLFFDTDEQRVMFILKVGL